MKKSKDIESLKAELDQERNYRDAMIKSNKDLENSIEKLAKELEMHRKQAEDIASGHFSAKSNQKYLDQVNLLKKLETDIGVEKEKLRILAEADTDITDLNLELLSQEFYRLDEMRQMYITEQDLKNRSKRHPPTPSASSRKHK
ncbi:uncharacterized protein [Bemisia tabaci]|uniref:uncharacterized protein isoform X3 n=1 Tax=Bemisia tabaci TaxID=7038 RepID=UPI003B285116